MKLTDHFTLAELTRSAYAQANGINNQPNLQTIANLTELCMVLERVRELCNAPINISSGYRCGKLNTAIGGSRTSAHVLGNAADFTVRGMPAKQTALLIAPLVKELGIDQLIYEVKNDTEWVHLGLSDSPRHEVKTIRVKGGKKTVLQGVI